MPDPVLVGANLTYTVTVTNNGPSAATGVTLTDPLPATVTFGSVIPSQGSCSETAGTVSCNLGDVATGATATVTLVVTPTAADPLTNTASVAGTEPDPNPENNSATVETTVSAVNQAPDGTIDAPAEDVTIAVGEAVTFAATCTDPENTTPLSFAWEFGGGAENVDVEDPGALAFATPGTFTVTFTCTDALGATDPTPATRTVTVNALPESIMDTPAEDVTIAAGEAVTFGATCTDADNTVPFSVAWDFGGGAPNVMVEDPGDVTFATPGIFTVTVTCTDALGATDPTPPTRTVTVGSLVDLVVTVMDVTTNAVLDGATVTVNGQSGTTDASGLVTFTNVTVGEIAVTVTRIDYLTHAFVWIIHTNTTGLSLFMYPLGEATLDTDSDGFPDNVETNTGIFLSALNTGTDASKQDTDGDGLNDGVEILVEGVR
jgi:uncharacterized repeat protein (TIGR01451 family)